MNEVHDVTTSLQRAIDRCQAAGGRRATEAPVGSEQASGAGAVGGEGTAAPNRPWRNPGLAVISAGYRQSPPMERAAFGMTASFAVTIAAARAITYVQERHRRLPAVRSLGRRLSQVPSRNSVRVHHSLPGMLLGFTAGGTSILTGKASRERWLSVPFGAGVALTMDELRLLAGRNNPYWGGRSFAFVQCAIAAAAAAALGADFVRRGRATAA